jgi:hypothetical protein
MGTRNSDLDVLAAEAKAKNIDDPQTVACYLGSIIERNVNYLRYRASHGRYSSYNEQVARDNEVLARAVQLLEEQGRTAPTSTVDAWQESLIVPKHLGKPRQRKRFMYKNGQGRVRRGDEHDEDA